MTLSPRIRERFRITAGPDEDAVELAALRGDVRLYFDEPFDEHADVVVATLDELWTWLGRERLAWWCNENMQGFEPLRPRTLDSPRQVLTRGQPRDLGLFRAKGVAANMAPTASECVADVALALRWHTRSGTFFGDAAGELRVLDSAERLIEKPAEWRDLVLRLCEALPVKSGVCGLVAEYEALDPADMALLYGAAMRHVGVDLDNEWNLSLADPGAIKGVNWLTVIGLDGVAELGGVDALRSAVGPGVDVHETRHAIVLQAGAQAQAGDMNRNDLLPAYRSVYAAVKRLQEPMIEAATSFQMGRPDDADRTEAWLRRFDPLGSP